MTTTVTAVPPSRCRILVRTLMWLQLPSLKERRPLIHSRRSHKGTVRKFIGAHNPKVDNNGSSLCVFDIARTNPRRDRVFSDDVRAKPVALSPESLRLYVYLPRCLGSQGPLYLFLCDSFLPRQRLSSSSRTRFLDQLRWIRFRELKDISAFKCLSVGLG